MIGLYENMEILARKFIFTLRRRRFEHESRDPKVPHPRVTLLRTGGGGLM